MSRVKRTAESPVSGIAWRLGRLGVVFLSSVILSVISICPANADPLDGSTTSKAGQCLQCAKAVGGPVVKTLGLSLRLAGRVAGSIVFGELAFPSSLGSESDASVLAANCEDIYLNNVIAAFGRLVKLIEQDWEARCRFQNSRANQTYTTSAQLQKEIDLAKKELERKFEYFELRCTSGIVVGFMTGFMPSEEQKGYYYCKDPLGDYRELKAAYKKLLELPPPACEGDFPICAAPDPQADLDRDVRRITACLPKGPFTETECQYRLDQAKDEISRHQKTRAKILETWKSNPADAGNMVMQCLQEVRKELQRSQELLYKALKACGNKKVKLPELIFLADQLGVPWGDLLGWRGVERWVCGVDAGICPLLRKEDGPMGHFIIIEELEKHIAAFWRYFSVVDVACPDHHQFDKDGNLIYDKKVGMCDLQTIINPSWQCVGKPKFGGVMNEADCASLRAAVQYLLDKGLEPFLRLKYRNFEPPLDEHITIFGIRSFLDFLKSDHRIMCAE